MPKWNMYKPFAALTMLFFCSCNSPEARLDRLQHAFWEKFARQGLFEVRLKNEVIYWPLPPETAGDPTLKSLAAQLSQEANSIEKDQLSVPDQKQLTQLRAALSDCVAQAGSGFFDPSRCSISACLKQFSTHPELPLLLEKVPVYYQRIEEHWQIPDTRFISKAVEESQLVLDQLKEIEGETRGAENTPVTAARGAVKDFIGMCQSALLGAGVK